MRLVQAAIKQPAQVDSLSLPLAQKTQVRGTIGRRTLNGTCIASSTGNQGCRQTHHRHLVPPLFRIVLHWRNLRHKRWIDFEI